MRRLVIAYTPYHMLLATAALQGAAGENHLIVVRDFGEAARMAEVLGGPHAGPYATAAAVGGCFGVRSRLGRQLRYRRATAATARVARELAPDEVWVGNDARPESHAAFRAARVRGGRPLGVLVEDGLTAYAAGVSRPLTWWEQAAGRLLFGHLWCGIAVLGTSGLVSKGVFVHPALVRPELARLSRAAVPRAGLSAPGARAIAERMVRVTGGDPACIADVNAVVTVAHSSVAAHAREYKASLERLIRQLTERGCTVALKYHPREAEEDYLGVGDGARVRLLPRGLPLEYVYVLASGGDASDSLSIVLGDVSTTLLTARWLVPHARVVSFGRPLGLIDPDLERLFDRLGIDVPATIDSIC